MQKNVAGQKWVVFAFDLTDNTAKTGDAANITGNLRIDGGIANAIDDTNPTELEDGYYIFDLTQTETDGDSILIAPASVTANIQVIGVPATVWTTQIGSPVALDSGAATIAGMLAKMADDNGGADFVATTDSLEAIRDRGDAAWTGGGGITDILNITPLIPPSVDLADTSVWRLGIMLINSLDDLPSTAEITPGTIDIDRKTIGGTSWTSIVSGAACSELAGLVYYEEVFDTGTGYAEGDSIRVTFKSQKIVVAANDYEISDANGRSFYTEIRQTMRGTDSAALDSVATEARLAELDAANLPTDVDDILLDTVEIGTAGIGLTDLGGMSTGMKAEVNAEADAALSDIGLDHLISAAVAGADVTDDSIIAQMVSKSGTADWDSFTNTTDALEAIADAIIAGATLAAIASAVWDKVASAHKTPGTFGEILGAVEDKVWEKVIEAGAPVNAQTAQELYRIMVAALAGVDGDDGSDWSTKAIDDSKVRLAGSLTSTGLRSEISTLDGS